MDARSLRIGNASGFYGDRFSAFREMLEGGPLDVLTGDYLAELTMLILGRDRLKNPSGGYARTFLRQLEETLGLAVERKVRIVTNAGGLNPEGLANDLRALATKLGVSVRIAHVEGDDLVGRADELGFDQPLTANAYLGGWGIAACLEAGADIVVTGRVTDASLVVGPAAAHFGWKRDDWDRLAGAMVAGHVLECGAQATGGNFARFGEIDVRRPGFPLAEVFADGSSIITKHPGTGGAVTVDTVKAQLVYEIGGARYAGPDATARFDTIGVSADGPDRVRLSGVRGEPPPPDVKVCLNRLGGFRNDAQFILVGLDIEEKAALVRAQLEATLKPRPAEVLYTLARTDQPDAPSEEQASARLRVSVKDSDPKVVGRSFSGAVVELALCSYPGFFLPELPGEGSPFGVYTPGYVDARKVPHVAVLPDGRRVDVTPSERTLGLEAVPPPSLPAQLPPGTCRRVPLGQVALARSGDKGGDANIGVWVRTEEAWRWLVHTLTEAQLRTLLPEARELSIQRHVLPNLFALNFVIEGLLGEGVSSSTRFDQQAKALGEWLRSRHVDVPESLL
ncbi:DUF1446 domain-containing protein [Corallococcus sp. AB049A]|uniref:DUF1446 domain-containing protein n=1 Tax=Corallococcus interemptor TaxID=2316720 RepID=A0A3A8QP27_9BACT|nr:MULTISPECIES: acyclic terpene utilization AtuA family protein [Corallococcus]RKH46331.1 DUF1446 domain-containing protein [Corallococcus sp. AB050B]RKH70287.1 DUF1446 domain-containing protein [Corallococcus interemptor]RKI72921.1 DUF1446 domain-containing protein [Corallococcus sp. AB049A]